MHLHCLVPAILQAVLSINVKTDNHSSVLFLDAVIILKNWGRHDLAVPFTPSTLNSQNRNQVCWNICAGVRRSTPYSEVV